VDYPGRIAAVFFTSGCNFHCGYCHNAARLGVLREGMPRDRFLDLCARFRAQWADGAVVTGGEPTLHSGLGEMIRELKTSGFAVKLDTNGSRPDVLEQVLDEVDYVAMDIKCAPARYPDVTGFDDRRALDRSVRLVRDRARDSEFRTTVIPGLHDDVEMRAVGEWIRGARRFVLQPFLPREDLPDPVLRAAERTRPQRLEDLRVLLRPYAAEVLVRGA
jgi:pyruvate formate lyase activating enzyme